MRARLVIVAFGLALMLPVSSPAQNSPAPAATAPAVTRTIDVRAPFSTLKLEVADTFALREYGLMNRLSVPEGTGMIFVFKNDGPETFWMKNTLVPLDMVFVRADGIVDSIAANVPASTLTTPDDKIATRLGQGKYVIELGAGAAARAGIKAGSKLSIPALAAHE
jgi:uncharacterized membrane protein (UPF0127 family)